MGSFEDFYTYKCIKIYVFLTLTFCLSHNKKQVESCGLI